jgi:hypothetical protein
MPPFRATVVVLETETGPIGFIYSSVRIHQSEPGNGILILTEIGTKLNTKLAI